MIGRNALAYLASALVLYNIDTRTTLTLAEGGGLRILKNEDNSLNTLPAIIEL